MQTIKINIAGPIIVFACIVTSFIWVETILSPVACTEIELNLESSSATSFSISLLILCRVTTGTF